MKATLPKTSSIPGFLAACASIALLSVPAKAGPPFCQGPPRTRISVGFSAGPGYRYGQPWPYHASPYYCPPPYVYSRPPVYIPPPVYVAPSYVVPPVYQGLPASSAGYSALAPAGSHLVAHVQEKLRNYGYYRGAVDGLTGPGTKSAIRSYQVDRGIQVTGRIDEDLLSDLGL